ncbi:MAG: hypothetical protein IPM79_28495 [Polyangiaceae bacterium]|nr:hypothetical protein [Polyangiaceae bacterium]
MSKRFSLGSSLLALVLSTAPSVASAHTVLVNPEPLTTNDDAKTPSCGCTFDGTGLECPPDFQITNYEPGETITVTWNETINHSGDFRITFIDKPPSEVTEADVEASTITMTIPDDQAGGLGDVQLTLPLTPCDECTIQVRQFMEGAADPYYYTCSAISIGGGGGGQGGAAGTGGSNPVGSGGGGPTGSGGSTGSGTDGEGGEPVWAGPQDDGGCTVAGAGSARGFFALALGLAALGFARGRRRSRG